MTPKELVDVCEEIVRRIDPSMNDAPKSDPETADGKMMLAFCEELLRVFKPGTDALRILKTLNDILPLSDHVYDVREREGQGWEGPQVVAWGEACAEMTELLK